MGREHVEDLRTDELGSAPVTTGALSGAEARVLSVDPSGASSMLVTLPDGFRSGPLAGHVWDFYVLSGSVSTSAGVASPGQYVHVPGGQSSGELVAAGDTELFVGVSGPEGRDGDVLVVDPEALTWEVRVRENIPQSRIGRSTNIVKFFRVDTARNEAVGLSAMLPGSGFDCAERHEPVDEVLMLRGDMLVIGIDGSPVEVTAGTYQWRPANARHLPKYSHTGALTLFRTLDGGWDCDVHFERDDRWPGYLERYREKFAAGTKWPAL